MGYNKLGRKSAHRKALIRNMVTQLYRHERIRTTKAKALEVRRKAEKFITRAKEDSVHNRRIVAKAIQDKEILAKLFTDIGPRFTSRPGGYTRILKIGFRKGDAAEMVLLELVEEDEKDGASKAAPKKETKKAAKPAVKEEPVVEKPQEEEIVSEESAENVDETEKKETSLPEKASESEKASEPEEETSSDESKES
ncbi:MAG: 50S ribosomal protein L17 [Spirochaetales bacterium]|nr:50S ribosomal protein L17 [Spirochaetales bacterium]